MQLTRGRYHAFHDSDAPCVDGGSQGWVVADPSRRVQPLSESSHSSPEFSTGLPKLPKPSTGLSLVASVPAPSRQAASWSYWDLARS